MNIVRNKPINGMHPISKNSSTQNKCLCNMNGINSVYMNFNYAE